MEWRAYEPTTSPSLSVQRRVVTPDSVPNPGRVASASWLPACWPARFVQPMAAWAVRSEPAGTCPPVNRVPKPLARRANEVAVVLADGPAASACGPTADRASRLPVVMVVNAARIRRPRDGVRMRPP